MPHRGVNSFDLILSHFCKNKLWLALLERATVWILASYRNECLFRVGKITQSGLKVLHRGLQHFLDCTRRFGGSTVFRKGGLVLMHVQKVPGPVLCPQCLNNRIIRNENRGVRRELPDSGPRLHPGPAPSGPVRCPRGPSMNAALHKQHGTLRFRQKKHTCSCESSLACR